MNDVVSRREPNRDPVLLIEDNPSARVLIEATLRALGTRFVSCDGVRAAPEGSFSAIIVDSALSEPFDVKEVKSRAVPIILTTANISVEVARLAAGLMPCAILSKPVSRTQLADALALTRPDRHQPSTGDLLDQAQIKELIELAGMSDDRTMGDLVLEFMRKNRERLANMEAWSGADHHSKLIQLAHQWKGMAATIGAAALARQLGEIEREPSSLSARRDRLIGTIGATDTALSAVATQMLASAAR